jgi:3-hydroxybutyryl-CoA dehydrogenase
MTATRRIAVIGGGTMGHGIAQVAAAAGIDVVLHDVSPHAIDAGLAAVRANLDRGVLKGKVTDEQKIATLDRLHGEPSLSEAVAGTDFVIEAVPESLELKRKIFAEVDERVDERTILASNTSSLSIDRIAEATRRPDRVLGLHFFNPVHLMALLEIVRGSRTAEDVVTRAVDLGRQLGKEPIIVRDSPGFASSRLGLVLGLEAMRMLEQGVASAEDIDKAMTLGYRHPMGPLRLTDLVGLDVRLAIADYLHRELESETFRPPRILRQKVERGELGKKSGRGFYEWDG